MFRHIVLLTFTDDAPAGHAELVVGALRGLPAVVPSIRAYEVGLDAGLADDNAHVAVVADFDDRDGYLAYRDHPEHTEVIRTLIRPHLAGRTALQHER
jgi:Stress responsive A/B Barrel Domain